MLPLLEVISFFLMLFVIEYTFLNIREVKEETICRKLHNIMLHCSIGITVFMFLIVLLVPHYVYGSAFVWISNFEKEIGVIITCLIFSTVGLITSLISKRKQSFKSI